MTSTLTGLSAIAVGAVVAVLLSLEFHELIPCLCLPEPGLRASGLERLLFDAQSSWFPALGYAVAAAFGAAASTAVNPARSTPIALAIGVLSPFLVVGMTSGGTHTSFAIDTALAGSVGGILMAGFGQRITLLCVRRFQRSVVPSGEGPAAELQTPRRASAYILRVVSLVNAVGAIVLIAAFVAEFAGPARTARLLRGLVDAIPTLFAARWAGLLAGLLGSIPTVVAARWMKENVAFKIAGASLCSSFIAISFMVTASVAIHSRWGKLPYNDAGAVANLRTINTAEATYASSDGRFGTIQELIDSGLLDTRYGGPFNGYTYQVDLSEKNYTAIATRSPSNMGKYEFYSTADGVVRYTTVASLSPPGAAGNPVQ